MAYCINQDVYDRTGLSSSEISTSIVDSLIIDAEAELESIAGRKFSNGNAVTEFINGPKKDIVGYSGTYARTINLNHYPVQSITSFVVNDINGSAVRTYTNLSSANISAGIFETTDYYLALSNDSLINLIIPYGKIVLKTDIFPTGTNNIKVSYTYGYATVPTIIKRITALIAGQMAWVSVMGGKYNCLNSYSIPQQSVDKGDIYNRFQINMKSLQEEADKLLDRIGRKTRAVLFTTTSDR